MYDVEIKIEEFNCPTAFFIDYEMPDDKTYRHYLYANNRDELKEKIKNALENDIPPESINLWLSRRVDFYFDEISRSVRDVVFLP